MCEYELSLSLNKNKSVNNDILKMNEKQFSGLKGSYDAFFVILYFIVQKTHSFSNTVHCCWSSMLRLS